MSANCTGVARPRAYALRSAATCSAGGLDKSTISSVAASSSRAASAARADRPPTAADRSLPPTPSTALTPAPAASSRQMTCCAPVPDAATIPIGPAGTACENPSPTPPTMAVPQSGPSTSRPRSAALSLSTISCSTGTLSEKIMTSQPASRASAASANAYWPGTEISARPGPVLRAALRVVRGGCSSRAGRWRGRLCRERAVHDRERGGERLAVVGRDRDEHVVRARPLGSGEAETGQQFQVELGPHRDKGGLDSRDRLGLGGDLHQRHRVRVGAAARLDVLHALRPYPDRSGRPIATSTPGE